MNEQRFEVQHRADESRYALIDRGNDGTGDSVIGQEVYVDVESGDTKQRVMHHTEVSPDYGGQGLAAVLVKQAVEHTIAAGFAVVPVCPYVVKWLDKNDEYADHVVKATPEHLNAVRSQQR